MKASCLALFLQYFRDLHAKRREPTPEMRIQEPLERPVVIQRIEAHQGKGLVLIVLTKTCLFRAIVRRVRAMVQPPIFWEACKCPSQFLACGLLGASEGYVLFSPTKQCDVASWCGDCPDEMQEAHLSRRATRAYQMAHPTARDDDARRTHHVNEKLAPNTDWGRKKPSIIAASERRAPV